MRKPALYSASRVAEPSPPAAESAAASATVPAALAAPAPQRRIARWPLAPWLAGLLLALAAVLAWPPAPLRLTQKDIDAAVRHALETQPLPSATARAAEMVAPSVVRVVGRQRSKDNKGEAESAVGTGVVIVDKGVILTNLHVVAGADRVVVTFADGLESDAHVTGVRPEHDLAVLQAHKIPDDLVAATMRSTQDLRPGDRVAALGFPFGIGPSVSEGVVSGLRREFRSPQGGQSLSNLIQFDAAANPGNSGGPLFTMEGEVVGIVTAILNPTAARTFIGIGFAVPIENAASAAGMPPF